MKRALIWSFFSTIAPFFATEVQAQTDHFAYAVTDVTNKGSNWSAIRKLDLQTGEFSPIIFNNLTESTADIYTSSKKKIKAGAIKMSSLLFTEVLNNGVAAMAYDKLNNRLYFTPMSIDQLRYLDLNTMQLNYITPQHFTNYGNGLKDESNIVTRMAIAPNGDGYALTNDSHSFIQFTTSQDPRVIQLGSLIDDPSNVVSIHNHDISYGGDMVADDEGNFYLITAKNNVFIINPVTRIARHLGSVKNLPESFTVNGMVVNAENVLLVSSAVDASALFEVDPVSLEAKPMEVAPIIFRSSDLANSNFLHHKLSNKAITTETKWLNSNKIQVFPNPVPANRFTVSFPELNKGGYIVDVLDITGRKILEQQVQVNTDSPTLSVINLTSANARGIYVVQIKNANNKLAFEQKVVVQ